MVGDRDREDDGVVDREGDRVGVTARVGDAERDEDRVPD